MQPSAAILAPLVDRILYCDINEHLVPYWNRLKRTLPLAPEVEFKCCDARAALVGVPRISVAFHRGDSQGEGGSALSIFRGRLAGMILNRFPPEGGLYITDGSNLWPKQFKRLQRAGGVPIHLADGIAAIGELGYEQLTRASGVTTHRWRLRPAPDQTLLESHGLWIITATREG
ncbi:MAG: hypothetical protein OXI39_06510 [Gemmatimonadota bacterium]|uniref:hypothetical protein n=1 Tax=Candidatus Palauibacter scopulicola TaxID=3056741 RepID=UPI002397F965|nr:hypothetical protein [Candidatus Palauibacter scopulicola]MDE2662641.1 hypothetical protein [Candidatus Palauibacter scopulicola]